MAGRLSGVASRIMGGNGIAARSAASALRSRFGMVWDNGTPYPEPCIDRLAPTVGKGGDDKANDNVIIGQGGDDGVTDK
ncbi:hypothetical protein C4D60_Mb04t21050 [Musa balbisiana]|uniref:Uncharacterized protein n=1 Tax=Musa balbisiana TaxID=52838 RepID=A0A4S8KDM0_MUSBA|nr:hypothetical protein C4D60_Mb04t21050 [Musa balbisiana]